MSLLFLDRRLQFLKYKTKYYSSLRIISNYFHLLFVAYVAKEKDNKQDNEMKLKRTQIKSINFSFYLPLHVQIII